MGGGREARGTGWENEKDYDNEKDWGDGGAEGQVSCGTVKEVAHRGEVVSVV